MKPLRAPFGLALWTLAACLALAAPAGQRVVTLGGCITEIACALGAEPQLVGSDLSSTYPESVLKLPRLGYHRNTSAESVLSLNPTLVLLTDQAGPAPVIAQIKDAGVPVVLIGGNDSTTGTKQRIRETAAALGTPEKAEPLIQSLDQDLSELTEALGRVSSKPRVLFIYARGAGTLMVGGEGTSAEQMIQLAGGVNAAQGVKDFRPLTAEAVATAAPDYILMMTKGFQSIGAEKGLLEQPGVAQTPAGRNKAFVVMDDGYLLGFGPRLGKAAQDLAQAIHPELKAE